jgi:NarL family two-component system response regulator LiaR
LRVLIVDDEKDVRYLVRICLDERCDEEIDISEAANGREAVDMAERIQPDVVVMDLRMPIMDGLEATQEIKKRVPDADIVVYSATTDHSSDVFEAGASGRFQKGDLEGLLGYICG